MSVDRVPKPGEVWVFRHLAGLGRGRVVIDELFGDLVRFVYVGTRATGEAPLMSFLRMYDWMATDLASAVDKFGPQHLPSATTRVPRPGTAVPR